MKTRTRIAAAIIAVAGIVATGGGVALASSGTQAAAARTPADTSSPATSAEFTWHPLHLIDGWGALSARYYGAPSYAIKDGVLYLSGILDATHATGGPEIAVLPAGARPKHYLWLTYYNFGGSGGNLIGAMEVEPDGSMFVYANTGPILNPSLQAISFPLSS